ncbi:diguanylate cyclase, partial [Escherichia coli]
MQHYFYYIHSNHITPCFIFVDDVLSCLQRLNNQHLPAVSWSCFVSDQIIARVSQSLAKEQSL